jgi:ELWxxDGT repeat protein
MKVYILITAVTLLLPVILSAQNPKLLKDINPGTGSSNPSNFVSLSNGSSFFTADDDDADTDKSLFYYSDIRGTQKINLVSQGVTSSKASFITPTRNAANNKVVFVGQNQSSYYEFWLSDGTQAGTKFIESHDPPADPLFGDAIAAFDNEVLYGVRTNTNQLQVRKINVQTEQVSIIKDFGTPAFGYLHLFTVVGDIMYFIYYKADGSDELWKSDGTAAGTVLVKNLGLGGLHTYLMPITTGSRVVFMLFGTGSTINDSLWVSDGTPHGTYAFKDFARNDTIANIYPEYKEDGTGNALFVSFESPGYGKQVWKTDGTATGTSMLSAFNAPSGCNPSGYYLDNGFMYFAGNVLNYGRELFRTTASSYGAFNLVKDFNTGAGNGNPVILGKMPGLTNGDLLIVSANDGTYGQELYAVDANVAFNMADKILIQDLSPGIANANPVADDKGRRNTPLAYNNIYFSATTPAGGNEVYRLDGFNVAWKKTGSVGNYYDAANWVGDNLAMISQPSILVPYKINGLAPAPLNLAHVSGGNGAQGFWMNGGSVEVPDNFLVVGEYGLNNATANTSGGSFILSDNGQGFPNKIFSTNVFYVPVLINSSHQLTYNFIINGTLTLANNSRLILNDYYLLEQGNLVADSTNFIVTNGNGVMYRNLGAAANSNSFKFPIGPSEDSYNPITITNTGTTDYFAVRVQPKVLQAGTTGLSVAANVVNRTWHISENVVGGSIATLGFQWDSAHEALGFHRLSAQGAHYTGTSWAFDPMSNISNTNEHLTATLNNVTSFSPYTLTSNTSLLQTHTAGTGPGGVGNTTGTDKLKIWLKADLDAFSNSTGTLASNLQSIQQWNDKSGAGNHAKRYSNMPVFSANSLNGYPALSFAGNSGSQYMDINYNISPAVLPRMSLFTVSNHNNMVTNPLSKLWGHEDGGYDRGGIGTDWRTATNMGYHSGINSINFFNAVKDTTYIISANYTPTSFSGWARGINYVNNATVNHGAGKAILTIGNSSTSSSAPTYNDYWNGKIAEFILYNDTLNKASRIVVENYLAAKYGARLEANDIYLMDNPANGNYDHDVVGLGRADDGSYTAGGAQGSNPVRMQVQNALSGISNDQYLFWGHDNKPLTVIADTSVPLEAASRMQRVWRVSEKGNLGPCRVYMTIQNLAPFTPAIFCMLIDKNNNNSFADETVAGGGIIINPTAFSPFLFFDYPDLANGQRFTFCSLTPLTYTFNGNGNFTDASNWLGGNIPPSEITGGIEVIIDPAVGGQCILNVPFYIRPGAKLTIKDSKQFVVKGNLTQY